MPGSIAVPLIFLLIPLTLPQRCGAAADSITAYELLSKNCSSSGDFSSGGGIDYEMNLRQFLATLPSNVISNRGFYKGSVGGPKNAVFGMAMCQADMAWPDQCESCLQAATAEAPKSCPSSYNASLAYRGCVLLYWDRPLDGDAVDNGIINKSPTQDLAADPAALIQTRKDLFKDLSSQIVTSPLRIASGNRKFNSTHNLYGLAQCNRDLSKDYCSYYTWAVVELPMFRSDAQSGGMSIIGYTYYIRYDLKPFQVYMPSSDNSSGATGTAKDVVQYKDCSSSVSSDPYQLNLRQFLDALPSSAINNSGFFNGSTAGSENKVFGTAMCQADIPWPDQCKNCLQAASAGAPKACPASTNASVAYQGCVLRYSDMPILADDAASSNSVAFYTQNNAASVPDTTAFQQARQDLLSDLAGAALISPVMIGSGNRSFNSTHSIYGLAQCDRDLPRELCSSYIKSVALKLAADVQWSEGVSITGFNFYVRYDLTPFAVYVPPTDTNTSQPEKGKDVPPTAGTGPSQPEKVKKGGLVKQVEVIVIPIFILVIFFLVAFIVRYFRQCQKQVEGASKQKSYALKLAGLKDFSYDDIKSATKNFDKDLLIGAGAFGKVYKGTFNTTGHSTEELAVKCVTNPSTAKQLNDELEILAILRHKNVVQLVGFCNNDEGGPNDRALYVCNEFVNNGSLDKHIFASSGKPVIEWPIRYKIILDICDGLKYLHQDSNKNILHMDLKPSNILLNEKMEPKIADFGLSRAFLKAKTHTHTMNVIGSNGYMAPESIEDGMVSLKFDIYSLGVIILAIVMGEGPTPLGGPSGLMFINKVREKFNIEQSVCSAKDREQLKKDASLQDNDCIEDVEKCVGLAFKCVNMKPEDRPTAADILHILISSDNRSHISLQVNQLHT